ncbi:hypothetical protein ColKHC_07445 [Colletotrichum higginsianum]|nr:hypothetical protein ColKHC_07445 [Colletotrichum higginsianum]
MRRASRALRRDSRMRRISLSANIMRQPRWILPMAPFFSYSRNSNIMWSSTWKSELVWRNLRSSSLIMSAGNSWCVRDASERPASMDHRILQMSRKSLARSRNPCGWCLTLVRNSSIRTEMLLPRSVARVQRSSTDSLGLGLLYMAAVMLPALVEDGTGRADLGSDKGLSGGGKPRTRPQMRAPWEKNRHWTRLGRD